MTLAPFLTLLAVALPATGSADTTRYHLTATLSSAITPEGEVQPQEQVVEAKGWLQLTVPTGAGSMLAVIDSGTWSTRGFEMVHDVSTAALRGMELRATMGATGQPTTAMTGAGEHPIAGVFQDILGFVRGAPSNADTDSLVTATDGDHWRLHRAVTWTRQGEEWQGAITATILAREPDTSAGNESGTVTLRLAPDGTLHGATIEVTRNLTIASEHGTVLVKQTIQGTLTRIP